MQRWLRGGWWEEGQREAGSGGREWDGEEEEWTGWRRLIFWLCQGSLKCAEKVFPEDHSWLLCEQKVVFPSIDPHKKNELSLFLLRPFKISSRVRKYWAEELKNLWFQGFCLVSSPPCVNLLQWKPNTVLTLHDATRLVWFGFCLSRANVELGLFHFLPDVAKKEEKRRRVKIIFPKLNFYIKQKGNEPAAAARRGPRRLMTCRVPVTKISNPPQSPKT